MPSRPLETMTLHCSVSEILHGLWTKRRQFDTTNHNCGGSASFFVASSLLGPRIFSFLSDLELLHGMSSIISWVGLVSFSLTLHTSWLFLATFDSVHVHQARINQCPGPCVTHCQETGGGTDDCIQRIHLSSKLPTRNTRSRISKAEREAFKTKHAFWVYFKDSGTSKHRVACSKFTNIQ